MKNKAIREANMILEAAGLPPYQLPPNYPHILAIEEGRNKYNSDRPCRRGHDPVRYTNNRACVECVAGYFKKRQKRTKGPD